MLAGIRVLDLSQYIPGPFATLMLADLGAEVVKIEPPAGEPMRGFGPREADGTTPFYKALNAGKTVLRLDLKGGGRDVLAELVAKADVLLESYRPGTLEKLGFGPQALRGLNPRLVHCALSGFGQTGPWRLRAGHDLSYLALTGGLSRMGPEEAPAIPFPPPADHAGAMQAVIAILAALVRRGRSGEGATLDVSLYESALAWQYMTLSTAGRDPGRGRDLLSGGAAFYRIYRTKDAKFLAVAPIEPKFWQSFCEAAERPDLVARQDEPLPQQDLIAEVAKTIAARTLAEWVARMEPKDCCVEPVLEPEVVAGLDHVRARGLLAPGGQVTTPVLEATTAPAPRRPWREVEAAAVLSSWG